MAGPVYLIYLDTYHLDDLLYLNQLAHVLGRLRERRPPCVFLHGSGGQAERLLEAEGLFPLQKDGLFEVKTETEAALVERAMRQVNRRIVGAFTEQGVHTVGFQGLDRGLLQWGADGMEAGALGWMEDLIGKRVVPVVSALVRDAQTAQAREVPLVAATLTLAQALQSECVVVFLTKNDEPGVRAGEHVSPILDPDRLTDAALPEPGAVRAVVAAGIPTLLTSAVGLYGADAPQGTWVENVINGQY